MTAITARGVYKIFGDDPETALKLLDEGKSKAEVQEETKQVIGVQNVSFQLNSGDLYVIMGLSGSGKSTLLRCINRLLEPTRGKIVIESEDQEVDVTSLSKKELRKVREKQIAMIFQHFALFPYRSVISNVTFGLEIQGMDKNRRFRKGKEVLELVGLGGWADAYPSQLSGGMQQRVGLARALANDAEVLLMDEPFSALDPLIKVNMQDELLKLREKVQRTILFVTHDLDEALKIGDRIAIMEDGKIVQSGTPEEIIVNPRTEYVTKFVEHADPTGVLTAGTVVKPLSAGPEGTIQIDSEAAMCHPSLFAQEGAITYCLSNEGRLLECLRDGKSFPVERWGEDITDFSEQRDVFIAVEEDTTLREVMDIRLKACENPVIVVSEKGEFKGIITVQEILQGILEKGRKAINEKQEEVER
jgi:glycine betaine/proline transport system ATP-binding protein